MTLDLPFGMRWRHATPILLATDRRLFRGGAPGTYLTRGLYISLAAKAYASLAHTDRDLDETPHGLRQEPGGRRLTAQPGQE